MDIILIIVMALGIFLGYKRGFIRSLFSMIGILLAIILALISYKSVVNIIINKTDIYNKVYSYVETKVDSTETFINMPDALQNYIDADVIVNQAQSSVASKLTNFIINIGTLIVLIVIFYIIIIVIRIILDNVAKLPIFNIFNKLGGAVLGGLKTYIIVLVAFTIINLIGVVGKGQTIIKMVDNSLLAKKIYYNNPISELIVQKQIDQVEEIKKEGNNN